MKHFFLLSCFLFSLSIITQAQDSYIESTDGVQIMLRRNFENSCLKSMGKDRTDKSAVAVCECMSGKWNNRFSFAQFSRYSTVTSLDMEGLLKLDTVLQKELDNCVKLNNKSLLYEAEFNESTLLKRCIKKIRQKHDPKIDTSKVQQYCECQINLVRQKKISDKEIDDLNNPNSQIFYQFYYNCEFPLIEKDTGDRNWNEKSIYDVEGPDVDTVKILNFKGMTFVKMKIGNNKQIWMLDTGASELFVTKETEDQFKKEGIITDNSFLGTSEFELADGRTDTCRRYLINGIQIGKYKLNNVHIAVSDKAKRILLGRSVLNKFGRWILDNKKSNLILIK